MRTYRSILFFITTFLYLCSFNIFAEEKSSVSGIDFKPVAALQAWGTYTQDENNYENRADIHFRRLRFGGKGHITDSAEYNFQFHNDRLGESPYAASRSSNTGVGIWNALISIKPLQSSDVLHIHTGYYQAVVSHENNVSPWTLSSFDKASSDWFLRKFVTGKGNCIESGAGLGGLYNTGLFTFGYRTSAFNPKAYESPHKANLLYTGRATLSFGDGKQKKYSYMIKDSNFTRKSSITVGAGSSYQGSVNNEKEKSELVHFDYSRTYGYDLYCRHMGFSVDGEYYNMKRGAEEDFTASLWHIRAAYIIPVNKYYFEASFMRTDYKGEGFKSPGAFTGDDVCYDTGINWYIFKDKLKYSLHYVVQDGSVYKDNGNYIGSSLQLKL